MINFSDIPENSFFGKLLRFFPKIIPGWVTLPIFQGRIKGKKWIKGSGVNGYWLGSYESEQQSIMEKTIKFGDVVFDIGAHVGFFTLFAAELVGEKGRAIAFEPLLDNIHFLNKHIKLNKFSNITVMQTAVSNENGLANFRKGKSTTMGSIDPNGELEVSTISIDKLLEEKRVPPPTFLKIDVEGAQNLVLAGAIETLKRYHPAVLMEAKYENREGNFYQLLLALGYTIRPLGHKPIETAGDFFAYVQ